MPPGGALAASLISSNPGLFLRRAGEDLSSHRVVYIGDDNLFYLAQTDDCRAFAIGITVQSALEGEPIYARFTGELADQSFDWNEGPIFLGPNGTLTQSPPSSGILRIVGTSAGRNAMRVTLDPAILLSE